jgi:hypothetical protein
MMTTKLAQCLVPWGLPQNASEVYKYRNYFEAIDRFFHSSPVTPSTRSTAATVIDVVLIDGRARVGCAIKALWRIDDASVVLLHDYIGREGPYASVLHFYDVIDLVDTMVVLSRKRNVDWDAAERILERVEVDTARR